MKRTVSFILSLLFVCSIMTVAFADGPVTLTNVNEVSRLVYNTELIAIYDATLHTDTDLKVKYVVCKGLDFSEFDPDQPRSYANAIKIGLSCENNSYVNTLVNTVTANVNPGEQLVFVGHSMGGMVLQQAIANKSIKDNYEVVASLAIGSPYILTKGSKEGTFRRVVDKMDPIPVMSIPLLANNILGNVSLECSGLVPLVHFRSYESGKCWNSYDCLGVKNGGATISLNQKIF